MYKKDLIKKVKNKDKNWVLEWEDKGHQNLVQEERKWIQILAHQTSYFTCFWQFSI